MSISVVVFLTHDNTFTLEVSRGGVAVDLNAAGVTRVVVSIPSMDIDSAVDSAAFDYVTNGATGLIEFDFADLSIPVDKHECDLIIYDVLHPDGQVWENAFELNVKASRVP